MITNPSTTNKVYVLSGIAPIRKDASDTAEMVTQALLGETLSVHESVERWHRVTCDFDGYEGWISVAQVVFFDTEADYQAWTSHPERHRSPFFTYRITRGKSKQIVPVGAPIVFNGFDVELPDGRWDVEITPLRLKEHAIIDTAMQFLGVPYLWGGRTDSGIDCSGYIQMVYSLHHYDLPRDASQQFKFAPLKESMAIEDMEYGDVVYFHGKQSKNITHVGFYLGDGKILHASGNVQIQLIDPKRKATSRYEFNEALSKRIAGVQSNRDIKAAAIQLLQES
ncbi:MAG: Cell wall-associated hydrolases (invasion-associated proteins) [Bacteroidetes bacterium HLUCCA01]|nr:MAG: Cell wall-associated hydrolases (invasion-associated proteins) [Bacteroidetes bacterium HLUCCA01]